MAMIKDKAAPVFDRELVRKGDLIRAKHHTWDEYRNGLIVEITESKITVLYHTGYGNVSNHFFILADEISRAEWQGIWTSDMESISVISESAEERE